jgi:hypothetical protein
MLLPIDGKYGMISSEPMADATVESATGRKSRQRRVTIPSFRSWIAAGLFAPREVYVRDPQGSHYTTLSAGLQLGVFVATVALIAALAFTSISALGTYLHARSQELELERLTSVNKSLRAAVDAIGGPEALREATRRLPALNAELAAAEAGRARALDLAAAAEAEAAELRRELELVQDQLRALSETIGPALGPPGQSEEPSGEGLPEPESDS